MKFVHCLCLWHWKKKQLGHFFLVNDEWIRCLIAWDYTSFKGFKWRKIFSSWEAFNLLHSDSCSCNKYTRSLKGLTEKGQSFAFLYSLFNCSRGWVMYELVISLFSECSRVQAFIFQTHAHMCTRLETKGTQWLRWAAYILRGSWTFGDVPWSPIIALVLGAATVAVPIKEESWKYTKKNIQRLRWSPSFPKMLSGEGTEEKNRRKKIIFLSIPRLFYYIAKDTF